DVDGCVGRAFEGERDVGARARVDAEICERRDLLAGIPDRGDGPRSLRTRARRRARGRLAAEAAAAERRLRTGLRIELAERVVDRSPVLVQLRVVEVIRLLRDLVAVVTRVVPLPHLRR